MFRGTLAGVDLQEILEWVGGASKTGALEVEDDRFRKVVYLIEGTIAGVASTEPADSLAHRLEQQGLLSTEQRQAAEHVYRRTGRALVDVLHKTGAVGDASLETAIEDVAREAVWGLFLWPDARFCFREDELPGDLPAAVSLEVAELLPEGLRRRARARAIRARLGSPRAHLVRAVEPCGVALGSDLEERVMELLGSPRSLLALMLELRAPEFALLEIADRLLDEEAVRVATEVPAATGAAASESATGPLAGPGPGRAPRRPAPADPARTAAAPAPDAGSVAVLEAPAGPELAKELLALARRQMELRRYRDAIELFRRAEQPDPSDARLAALRTGAEAVHAEVERRRQAGA